MARLTPDIIEQNGGNNYRRRDINAMLRSYGFYCKDSETGSHSNWAHSQIGGLDCTVAGHGTNGVLDAYIVREIVSRCRSVEEARREKSTHINATLDTKEWTFTVPESLHAEVHGNQVILRDEEFPEIGATLTKKASLAVIRECADSISMQHTEHKQTLDRLEKEYGYITVAGHGNKTRLENPDYELEAIELPIFDGNASHYQDVKALTDKAEMTALNIQDQILELQNNWKLLHLTMEPQDIDPEDPGAGKRFVFTSETKALPLAVRKQQKRTIIKDSPQEQNFWQRWSTEVHGVPVLEAARGKRDFSALEVYDYGLRAPMMSASTLGHLQESLDKRFTRYHEIVQKIGSAVVWQDEALPDGVTRHHIKGAVVSYDTTAKDNKYALIAKKLSALGEINYYNLFYRESLSELQAVGIDAKKIIREGTKIRIDALRPGEAGFEKDLGVDAKLLGPKYLDAMGEMILEVLGREVEKIMATKHFTIKGMDSEDSEYVTFTHIPSGKQLTTRKYFFDEANAGEVLRQLHAALALDKTQNANDKLTATIEDAKNTYGFVVEQRRDHARLILPGLEISAQIPVGNYQKAVDNFIQEIEKQTAMLEEGLSRQQTAIGRLQEMGWTVEPVSNGRTLLTASDPSGEVRFTAEMHGIKGNLSKKDVRTLESLCPAHDGALTHRERNQNRHGHNEKKGGLNTRV